MISTHILYSLILFSLQFRPSCSSLPEVTNARQVAQLVDDQDLVLVVWGSKACAFCRKVEEAVEEIQDDLAALEIHVTVVWSK